MEDGVRAITNCMKQDFQVRSSFSRGQFQASSCLSQQIGAEIARRSCKGMGVMASVCSLFLGHGRSEFFQSFSYERPSRRIAPAMSIPGNTGMSGEAFAYKPAFFVSASF